MVVFANYCIAELGDYAHHLRAFDSLSEETLATLGETG